jgi:hypothetical protein
MLTPNGSQKRLQTVTQWRYCLGACQRGTPMRKIAGDTIWQCPYCGYHEPESVQTSAQTPRENK